MATTLLTADKRALRKAVDKRQGFPPGSADKAPMQGLLNTRAFMLIVWFEQPC